MIAITKICYAFSDTRESCISPQSFKLGPGKNNKIHEQCEMNIWGSTVTEFTKKLLDWVETN
jgi:hypothetical protein